jgi:hypothetical protein
MTIRTDHRQWLIDSEEPVTAATHGVMMLALALAGKLLEENQNIELRAVGNVMGKMSDARYRAMIEGSELEQSAADLIEQVFAWMGGAAERPDAALDELHAAMFGLDRHLNSSGLQADTWATRIAKGHDDGR